MFSFFRDPGADGVGVAFTDAIGPDARTLSLGGAHGAAGRPPGIAVVESALGVRVATVRQVHSATVVRVDDAEAVADVRADAMTTTRPGLALAVRVADCVPVVFADPAAGIVAAAHAGRVGLAEGVLPATVAAMRGLGARSIAAWVGPHICGRCYEVPAAMADAVERAVPGSRSRTSWGTPALDLGAGAGRQLEALDVAHRRVPGCTLEDTRLHSHRRDAQAAGRQAGLVWLA